MKDKEDVGFIEKPRKFRNRTKKRRLLPEEIQEKHELHPRHQPYQRKKNWVDQIDEE